MPSKKKSKTKKPDNWDEIRGHLLLASRELLLAASGVMKYIENEGFAKNSPSFIPILKQASKVANDLAKGIICTPSFSALAVDMLTPIIRGDSKPKKKASPKRKTRGKK